MARVDKFENSDYFVKLNELINHPRLAKILEEHDKILTFYPHRNMQKFKNCFDNNVKRVKISSLDNEDIQILLKRSAMLITDYSSVFMDMVYMQKPVLFYQFDEKKFRAGQHGKGYFDYKENPYSVWSDNVDGLLDNLEKLLNKEVQLNYNIKELFPLYDSNNSERIYQSISNEFDL